MIAKLFAAVLAVSLFAAVVATADDAHACGGNKKEEKTTEKKS
jgi:hypothetical protein